MCKLKPLRSAYSSPSITQAVAELSVVGVGFDAVEETVVGLTIILLLRLSGPV